MPKTKKELLEYAIKMRQRGDTYRTIMQYLERNCDEKDVIKEIISSLDLLEKQQHIKVNQSTTQNNLFISKFIGALFIILGIFLIIFLWKQGFIAWLPLGLVIIGLFGITGKIKK